MFVCWCSSWEHMLTTLLDLRWKQHFHQDNWDKTAKILFFCLIPACSFPFILSSLPFPTSLCFSLLFSCSNNEGRLFHRSDRVEAAQTWSSSRRSGHSWGVDDVQCVSKVRGLSSYRLQAASLVFNSPLSCLFRPFAPLLTGSRIPQLDYS